MGGEEGEGRERKSRERKEEMGEWRKRMGGRTKKGEKAKEEEEERGGQRMEVGREK